MPRYFLTLSYNGRDFNGWQIQENTPNTVEQVLEEKLSMLLREKIDLVGCGRTDTGVNAKNFVAHFDTGFSDLLSQKKHWLYKFNTVLPPTVAVHDIRRVKDAAHARFDAQRRVYYYFISQSKNPFRDAFTWYVYGELDFDLMNKAACLLTTYSDFSCFSKTHTQVKSNVCKVEKAVWQRSGESEWRFMIVADRFLRGMVRAIVGTLVLVGKGRMSMDEFRNVMESGNRQMAGSNAPANALFLNGISYRPDIYIEG